MEAVESGLVVGATDDDGAVQELVLQALVALLDEVPGAPGQDTWRGVVTDVHSRAAALAQRFPVSWTTATTSCVSLDAWVRDTAWAQRLRRALWHEGAGAGARWDAPLVVALHLRSLRAQVHPAGGPADGDALSRYPQVTRLRPLLSCGPPEGSAPEPGAIGALVADVERLLTR